ncbi:Pyrimidine-nucleoside phosphorylase [Mesoplasma sp. JKS002657]|nr:MULTISPECIES: thymidine phosphorylase [unclassified Mesoplasma]MCL8213070.1 Pyrimidine-nucleoside phosphorylase [Mesoplasma sp. JKS002661]MCL8216331.1 Pyrimidine-nucleoside phosphorylase [Mesoplasma sp. JKS002657]
MRMIDIIEKKKENQVLSEAEINFFVEGYVHDQIPDYQVSALLMAIYLQGMNDEETTFLTSAYANSGDTYDLSDIQGFKVDKHSTGGIGDKITLIYSPLAASYGLKVCKLAGRGLGQTGGTIDKLESCPGWQCELSVPEFKEVINKVGMSVISQSENMVPGDKKIYALRDVTATVGSLPLIAASVMSKKLIMDADGLVLDVKVGDGAFMKDLDQAEALAKIMIKIGHHHQRKMAVMLSNMNKPLGKTIGNALEVREAWDTLHGKGPDDLNEVAATSVALSLVQAGLFEDIETAKSDVFQKMQSGEAAHYLKDFIQAQGGDFGVIENYDQNFKTTQAIEIKADKEGYLQFLSAGKLGTVSMKLGAGRETKTDAIDFAAGIVLNHQNGELVKKGEVVMTLYTNKDFNQEFVDDAKVTFELISTSSAEPAILKIIAD